MLQPGQCALSTLDVALQDGLQDLMGVGSTARGRGSTGPFLQQDKLNLKPPIKGNSELPLGFDVAELHTNLSEARQEVADPAHSEDDGYGLKPDEKLR